MLIVYNWSRLEGGGAHMVCALKVLGTILIFCETGRQEGTEGSEKGLYLLAYSSLRYPDPSLEADRLNRERFFIQII